MTDFEDFAPITRETIDTIRARLDADANGGLTPTDPAYLDTTPGGFYFDMTQPGALEAERLWDFIGTEVVAAMFVQFAWGDYLDYHGEQLGVARKDAVASTGEVTFSGTDGTYVPTGSQIARPASDPDSDPVVFVTTAPGTVASGTTTVPIAADTEGTEGNVAAGTITGLLSPIPSITSVSNADATTGGTDPESDEAYRARLLLEYTQTTGAGTIADYERWALAYPGVGSVTVEPLWAGAGTVRVIITDMAHHASSTTVVNGLQAQLDPVAGQGHGLAPIGAAVTVATVANVNVNVTATVVPLEGYSLDGSGGTHAIQDAITAAISEYINSLKPGDDVVRARVESMFYRVPGVYDVTNVQLNGSSSNATISSLQVAQPGTITLI